MVPALKPRIERIQCHLGLEPDGIIGVDTLTAIENELFGHEQVSVADAAISLTVSKKGLKQLVKHEIGSAGFYKKFLCKPVYPGGDSGVTIGIGYDLGQNTKKQIRDDWIGHISDADLERLLVVCGLKGEAAKSAVRNLTDIRISLEAAEDVFYRATLPRFATSTANTYPGVDELFADAQAGLLSLVYNRGTKISGTSRREMKAIKPLVASHDYDSIADEIIEMKRLWIDKGLPGLLTRREEEANLIRAADRVYEESELVRL